LQTGAKPEAVVAQDCVETVVAESGKLRSGRVKVKAEAGAVRAAKTKATAEKYLIMFSFL
jgi:hypothetical protein